jgi:hypothetical protein
MAIRTPRNIQVEKPAEKSDEKPAEKSVEKAASTPKVELNVAALSFEDDAAPVRSGGVSQWDPETDPFVKALQASSEKREPMGNDPTRWRGAGKSVIVAAAQAKEVVSRINRAAAHLKVGRSVREEALDAKWTKVRFCAQSARMYKTRAKKAKADVEQTATVEGTLNSEA